ncbi:MAG: Gfo/Idh/MocA family oxidoreductase [Acidobacteriota bacterium]|nr:Gfo/Idh/MocA family oxidoreductase [Acidobacteriota bacterium]
MRNCSLRVAVVGVGHVGRHHARILSSSPDVELVAAVDIDRDRALQAVHGTSAAAETDVGALQGRVDAVTVAGPTTKHLEIAKPFLDAGVPVLVEKPMASSVTEANEMLAASAGSGACLAVGHTERFNPALVAVSQLIDKPKFIEVHRLGSFPSRSLDIDVVFDVMIHDLDVIVGVLDSDPVSIEAVGVPILSDRVDIANARLRFESGCIANLTASRISRDRVRKIRFFQSGAYLSVDYATQQAEAWRLKIDDAGKPTIEGGKLEVTTGEPLERELADFILAVRHGRDPGVSGEQGRRALMLAERITEQIARHV